jgi:cephalosporin hydroxylase
MMNLDPALAFRQEVERQILRNGSSESFLQASKAWMLESTVHRYSYCFSWLGRPIIQYPQDIVAFQEIVWSVKPDLIIETGVAHGGSLILSASLLALLDYMDAVQSAKPLDPTRSRRKVVGIDVDIRRHNEDALRQHPLSHLITTITGSSTDASIIEQVQRMSDSCQRVLVCLDSNHTESHVLDELEAYAPMVTPGSYCIVFDTVIEEMPKSMYPDRPWGPGDNPKTAVHKFVQENPAFTIDRSWQQKLMLTVASDGYLKRLS